MKQILIVCFCIPFIGFSQKPTLIVGIVVDQMCYDYLYRFQAHFNENGFNRFLNNGVNLRNTNYNYVPTYTGPGHASIYTGTTPSNHGIVANEWYDRNKKIATNCIFDETVHSIGSISKYGMASPHFLETFTITDQLKLTYPNSKVFSLSIKDRGAILPGGHLSDGSYWYDFLSGKFITSSYFENELPKWLQEFNSKNNADTYLKDWNLIHPKESYVTKLDNSPYEVTIAGKSSPEFPYLFTEFSKGNYLQFPITPFANTLLSDLAIDLIANEKIGINKENPDMLCISYSTPDIAGHAFGPYSLEIEDMYARLDKDLAKLFSSLDATIGKQKYLVFLTADHAVVPVPQQLKDQKLPGGYFDLSKALNTIRIEQEKEFGASFIEYEENLNIYLNHKKMDSLGISKDKVAAFTSTILNTFPEVKTVVNTTQIESLYADDVWVEMIRNGFVKERSGEVVFLLKPGYLPISAETESSHKGTSHGSAFNYDTHVPLLWYGSNLTHKEIFRPIAITDISATLVHILNLQRNGSMTGTPILEILGE